MKRARTILPVGLVLALGACTDTQRPLGRDFGDATSTNMSLQIVNPEPHYAGYGAPSLDGRRGAEVMKRYETGNVIQPEDVTTTSSQ